MRLDGMPQGDGHAAPDVAGDGAAHLRRLAGSALRHAVHAAQRGEAPDGQVREALRRACDAARERDLRAEELIVILKAAWHGLPEARDIRRHDSADVLARVITVCVDEYYARRRE
jgi:hypothetical protein